MSMPTVQEQRILCQKCGHESTSFLRRDINGVVSLIDRDGDVVYDLVKVCHYCGELFHWHSKEKTLQENSKAYQDLFELLVNLNKPSGRNPGNEQGQ